MGLIEEYEQQYSILTAEITSNISRLADSDIDGRRNLIIEINRHLEECREVLEQIDLEINENTNQNARSSLKLKLKSYEKELKRLEEEYRKSKIKPDSTLNSLDDSSLDDFDVSEDRKRLLLDNSETLERTGNRLADGYRVAIETEEIGANILSNLSQQRETIQRSRNRMRETDADLKLSSRVMNSMIMRSIRDKFALYIVGLIFIVGILMFVFYKNL